MTSSSCDSDDLAASGSASSRKSDSSERAAVEYCAQNVELYHFKPAASDTSSSSLESDVEVKTLSLGRQRKAPHNTNW